MVNVVKVRLEAFSELTDIFGGKNLGHIIIEEEIGEGTTTRKLFNNLAARYTKFKELVFNPATQKLTGNTVIILNGLFLELDSGLETPIRERDIITFVPVIGDG